MLADLKSKSFEKNYKNGILEIIYDLIEQSEDDNDKLKF